MKQLRYFPFGDQFDLRMGTSLFGQEDSLVEIDEDYQAEIALKRILLEEDHAYYYRSSPDTEIAQWDVVEKVLNDLIRFHPQQFSLICEGNRWHWTNRLLGEEYSFTFGDSATLPQEPLDWVGRQIQEDLVILSADGTATMVAAQLCFPNGWAVEDKFGQPFMTIHAPAPHMTEPTINVAQKLMERIPVNRPVWRASWNFKITDQLDLSTKYTADYNRDLAEQAPHLDSETIGEKLFIRIERQTISRLPASQAILFGIHTYQNTVAGEAADPVRAGKILNVLKTTPRAMLDYKAVSPFEAPLLTYLENALTK